MLGIFQSWWFRLGRIDWMLLVGMVQTWRVSSQWSHSGCCAFIWLGLSWFISQSFLHTYLFRLLGFVERWNWMLLQYCIFRWEEEREEEEEEEAAAAAAAAAAAEKEKVEKEERKFRRFFIISFSPPPSPAVGKPAENHKSRRKNPTRSLGESLKWDTRIKRRIVSALRFLRVLSL